MTHLNMFRSHPSLVGFDALFNQLEASVDRSTSSYPPHNLVKLSDDQYSIELAVAGFTMDDFDIEWKKNVLTVKGNGKSSDGTDPQYIYKGISQKRFVKTFNLADHIEVTGAELNNGILSISLEHKIPEELKPRKIAINSPQLLIEGEE